LGENEEATREYHAVIRNDSSRRWAKQANRRMIMLGEFYETRKKVAQEARKRLDEYQDQLFGEKVEELAGLVSESSLREELMAKGVSTKPRRRSKETDEILSFIDSIGAIDLTGEKDRQRRLEEMEAIRREMMKRGGEVSRAKLREIARQKRLASNPYRRPSAIKGVIDQNSGEVKYLYNRELRGGKKISGKMTVRIRIDPGGRVEETSVIQSSLGDQDFERKVCERIGKWRFRPVPDSLGALTVNYPFEFYKED
jgi:TonB family protein